MVEQRVKSEVLKSVPVVRKKGRKQRNGRPQGSPNRDKREFFKPSAELKQLNEMLQVIVKSLRRFVKVRYLALDGHFGHQQAVLMAQQNELELISKLRKDAVLFEKYEGKFSGRGAKKKYGARLKYDLMPPRYSQKSVEKEGEIINYYAGVFWHKEFAEELKVVIITLWATFFEQLKSAKLL